VNSGNHAVAFACSVPAKRKSSAPPRSWRASQILKRAQILGDVEAPSRDAAEAAAVKQFELSAEQRKRLVVQERGERARGEAGGRGGLGLATDQEVLGEQQS